MNTVMPSRTFVYMGLRTNEYHANKGEGLPKHEHTYAHLTMCVTGKCLIRKESKEFIADPTTEPVELRGKEWHEIEALEDGTVFINVFAEGKY